MKMLESSRFWFGLSMVLGGLGPKIQGQGSRSIFRMVGDNIKLFKFISNQTQILTKIGDQKDWFATKRLVSHQVWDLVFAP